MRIVLALITACHIFWATKDPHWRHLPILALEEHLPLMVVPIQVSCIQKRIAVFSVVRGVTMFEELHTKVRVESFGMVFHPFPH